MNRRTKSFLSAFLSASLAVSAVPLNAFADYSLYSPDNTVSVLMPADDAEDEEYIAVAVEDAVAEEAADVAVIPVPEAMEYAPLNEMTPDKYEAIANGTATGSIGENATWTIDDSYVLTVTGTGDMTDLLDGNATFASEWGKFNSVVKKIVISDGITSVGTFNFNGFTSVTDITIGKNVTDIGDDSFAGCTSLKKLTINATALTNIGVRAFRDCAPLASLTVPSTVTAIGDEAFLGCKNITSVTIPGGVEGNLGAGAFYGCTSLQSVVLSEGITDIKANTFSDCSALETLYLPKTSLKTIGDAAFNACSSLVEVDENTVAFEVPTSVTAIGTSAFNGCKSIKGLIISGSEIASIGTSAFNSCEGLKNVNITGGKQLKINASAFAGTKSLEGVTMGSGNVASLGDKVFYGSGIKTITMPETITEIGISAFATSGLTKITLPESLTTVKANAFDGCASLTDVTVKNQSRTKGLSFAKNAFLNCTALKNVDLSGTIDIGQTSFSGCTSLESITIPSSLTTMGSKTFNGCTKLSEVTIEEGAAAIGQTAFVGCSMLTDITVPASVTTATKAFQGNTYLTSVTLNCPTVSNYMFDGCKNLTSVTLNDTVTIGGYGFRGTGITTIKLPDTLTNVNSHSFENSALTAISFPDLVTELGESSFAGCTALSNLTLNNAVILNKSAFEGCTSLVNVTLPDDIDTLGVSAFMNCTSLKNVVIPSSIKWMGSGLFAGCVELTDMTLPDGLWEIPNDIFNGCTKLAKVHISPYAVEIMENAFKNCTALSGVTIPSTVTLIGEYAFANCPLIDTTIPAGVTSIDRYAFSGCTSLGKECTVALPTSAEYTVIAEGTFMNCVNLASPSIPSSVETIGKNAFSGCSSSRFVRIDIGGNVTSIGDNAFKDCANLQIVNITSSVDKGCESIGDYAFSGCSKLRSVPLPSTLTEIGAYAFNNCSSLTNVTVPTNVDTIGKYAYNGCTQLQMISIGSTKIKTVSDYLFSGCSALEIVELPNTVTSIGSYSFKGCSSLKDITIPVTVTKFGTGSFMNCTSLEYIVIPAAVETFGSSVFSGCSSLENAVVLPTAKGPTTSSKFFANCNENLKVYCYEGAKIISYLDIAKIPYEFIEGTDGSYLVILRHPRNATGVKVGDTVSMNVKVAAEGTLSYKWYYKNPGDKAFTLSDQTSDRYSMTVTDETDGQQVYVVVTCKAENGDANTLTSNTAIISSLGSPEFDEPKVLSSFVELYWSEANAADEYRVYRADSITGEKTLLATTTELSYKDTDVVQESTYYYFVTAYNKEFDLETAYSAALEVTVPLPGPTPAPTGLEAGAGNGKVVVTWNAVDEATKYTVYLYADGKYTTLADDVTDTSYTATGLTNGTKYGFKVKAFANNNWSAASAMVYATPDASAGVPKNVKAVAGNAKATVTWDKVTGATKYAVYIYEDGQYTCLNSNVTGTSYTATGLTNGKKVGFKIKAYFGGAWSSTSAIAYATPVAAEAVAPANVKATGGNTKATITWSAVTGASKYAVYIYEDGEYTTLSSSVTGTSYTATGLTNGKKVGFKVKSYVDGKWSAASDMAYATPMSAADMIPTNVKAVAGNAKATITWNRVTGATKYAVYIYEDGNYTCLNSNITTNSYTATGLTNGKKVGFKVKAYVGAWSGASAMVYATPVAAEAVAPSSVKAVAGDTKATITWSAVTGATKYAVYIYEDGEYTCLNSNITGTSYTATGLTNGKKVGFKVKAYVGAWSGASAMAYATPVSDLDIIPVNVKAEAGDSSAVITWDEVEGATKYALYIYIDGAYTCLASNIVDTRFTVSGLENGIKVGFKVKAYVGKWSGASEIAYATPEA